MSTSIEWATTSDRIEVTQVPGEWTDEFGSENDGAAVAIGDSIVIEGRDLEDLHRFFTRIANEVGALRFAHLRGPNVLDHLANTDQEV